MADKPHAGDAPENRQSFGLEDDQNTPSLASEALGKRKRAEDDDKGHEPPEDSLFGNVGAFIPPEDDSEEDAAKDESSHDSDSDTSDSDVPRMNHKESLELFPAYPIYHSEIPAIKARLCGVTQKVLDVLAAYESKGAKSSELRQHAEMRLDIPELVKPRIGLLGDAGAGKSSLLNSLTDVDDLAKSLSGGQSCTCVPTEYSSPFQDQKKQFAAIIQYFDIMKIQKMLTEMLDEYNIYTFQFDHDWDDDTRILYRKAKQNAFKTLECLFCDLDEFQSRDVAEEFLERNWNDRSVDAIGMFVESCEQKLKDKIKPDLGHVDFFQARTKTKLRTLVDPLMGSKPKGNQPALWPLVKQVRIGVRGSRVLDRVTLVDLPGISDTNTIRVELTKDYIKTCDHLWIVAHIRRVVDDNSVYHLLAMYGDAFRNNIMVICTHADDDIDPKLATYLAEEGHNVDPYYKATKELKEKVRRVKELGKKCTALQSRKRQTEQVLRDIQSFEASLQTLRVERRLVDQERFVFLVKVRVTHVTEQLQRQMQDHLPLKTKLPVICVSNRQYSGLKGIAKLSGPRLDPETTGIPHLRSYALSIPAPKLFENMYAFANTEISYLLESAHMWANMTSVERLPELLVLVKVPQYTLKFNVTDHHQRFEECIDSTVSKSLGEHSDKIISLALKKFEEKKNKHHATILAFLRRYGTHSTRVCPKECWNENFTRGISEIVARDSPTWEAAMKKNLDLTKNALIADLMAILTSLKYHPSAAALPMEKFSALIFIQAQAIENIFASGLDEYEKGIRNIKLDMTRDSEKNYFSKTIAPVYRECNWDCGTGVTVRSLSKLEQHLTRLHEESPFSIVKQSAIEALIAHDNAHLTDRIQPQVQNIYKETFAAFDRMISKTEDPREKAARMALLSKIDGFVEEYNSAMADLRRVKHKHDAIA